MKRRYTFGETYLFNTCRMGVAVVQGQQYYWLSDGYTNWLITAMNPATREVIVELWLNKPADTKKAKLKTV